MKSLIICDSNHRGNTGMIAKVFAEVLQAPILTSAQARVEKVRENDIVGFGSGIYMGKHSADLLSLADQLPFGSGQKVFIFSTSWSGITHMGENHKALRDKLEAKGYKIVGEFTCKGMATFGPLKFLGGINKGHPDKEEIGLAKLFAEGVKGGN